MKPGASSLIIHHTDARGMKSRGASPIRDSVYALRMMKADAGGGFALSSYASDGGKMKDAEERIQGFKLENHGTAAVVRWTGKAASGPYWVPVVEALQETPAEWVTGRDLKARAGVTETDGPEYQAIGKALRSWVTDKLIEADSDAPNTRPRYRMMTLPGH